MSKISPRRVATGAPCSITSKIHVKSMERIVSIKSKKWISYNARRWSYSLYLYVTNCKVSTRYVVKLYSKRWIIETAFAVLVLLRLSQTVLTLSSDFFCLVLQCFLMFCGLFILNLRLVYAIQLAILLLIRHISPLNNQTLSSSTLENFFVLYDMKYCHR